MPNKHSRANRNLIRLEVELLIKETSPLFPPSPKCIIPATRRNFSRHFDQGSPGPASSATRQILDTVAPIWFINYTGSRRPCTPAAAKRIRSRLRDWWINWQIKRGNSLGGDCGGSGEKEKDRKTGVGVIEGGDSCQRERSGREGSKGARGREAIFSLHPCSFRSLFRLSTASLQISPLSRSPLHTSFSRRSASRCTPNENLSIALPCRRI